MTNPDLKITVKTTGYHDSTIIPANSFINGSALMTIPFNVKAHQFIQFKDGYVATLHLENGSLNVEFNKEPNTDIITDLDDVSITLMPTANYGRRITDTLIRISFKLIYPNE